ncbi:MAG TPA: hypothetical protein VGQ26_12500 [Streptosporangiaceae bacterium]|jgi:hypothetical protein|nr:hypothetical protein [Streptosporangiaceae bacterium]
MPEYLIRTASTHELPALHRSRLADVLLPTGSGCEQAEGWGDFRMRCDTTEVAFSAEDPGWQVTFEGPMPEAGCERLVITLTQQIEQAAGEPCEWLRIT